MENSSTSISITIIHGQAKNRITLHDYSNQTVASLSAMVEELTGVPATSQKLIHKGKSLHPRDQLLSEHGVANNSKIMVLGKKLDLENDAFYQKITELGTRAEKAENLLDEIGKEIDGIEQDFLAPELAVLSLGKLEKRIKKTNELCLQTLETLDSLSLKEESKQVQAARKSLVERLHAQLDRGDIMLEKVKRLSTK